MNEKAIYAKEGEYVNYKMKEHTFDKSLEPEKALLNKDDIIKLNIVSSFIPKDEFAELTRNDVTQASVDQPAKQPETPGFQL